MGTRHFSDDRIRAICQAAIACDLSSQQSALLAGLSPSYTASLPRSKKSAARLLQTLHKMNAVAVLSDGTVPLEVWLLNAMDLTSARTEANVFKEALTELRRTAPKVNPEPKTTAVTSPGYTFLRVQDLPCSYDSLIDRTEILDKLRATLCVREGPGAVAALVGMAGVGKTTLASIFALHPSTREHFRAGVLWARLGKTADAVNEIRNWANDLGIKLDDKTDESAMVHRVSAVIQERARGEPLLVILDDVWNSDDIEPFRQITGPGMAYLVTTRNVEIARRFAGEEILISPVSTDEGLGLLKKACPNAFELEPDALRHLAETTGGLPFALSLMASELRANEGQALLVRSTLEKIQNDVSSIRAGGASEELEQQGLARKLVAIVESSVSVLGSRYQRAFANLGAFAPNPADFGRDDALAVCDVAKGGDAILKRLVDRSLLQISGEGRFTIHPLLSAVANARQGSQRNARLRHAKFYIELVQKDTNAWRRIGRELSQIRHAWQWVSSSPGNAQSAMDYAFGMRSFFTLRGMLRETLAWHERVSEIVTAGSVTEDAKFALLGSIAQLREELGEHEQALSLLDTILPLIRASGEKRHEAATLASMGSVHSRMGDDSSALRFYEQALKIFDSLEDTAARGSILNNIANIHSDRGETQQAISIYQQALPLHRSVGHKVHEANTLSNIANCYSKLGENELARKYLEEALSLRRDTGDLPRGAADLLSLVTLCQRMGNMTLAKDHFERADELCRGVDVSKLYNIELKRAEFFFIDGNASLAKGEHQAARELFEGALLIYRKLGNRAAEAKALTNIGLVSLRLGDVARAIACGTEALPLHLTYGQPLDQVINLRLLSWVYLSESRVDEAIEMLQKAVEIRRSSKLLKFSFLKTWLTIALIIRWLTKWRLLVLLGFVLLVGAIVAYCVR